MLSDLRKSNGHGNTFPTASIKAKRYNIVGIVSVQLHEGIHGQQS